MKNLPLRTALFAAVLAALQPSAKALDLWPFNNKEEKPLPSAQEIQSQEASASAMLAEAKKAETDGNSSRAVSTYKRIVDKYPLTKSAAEAQYKIAAAYEAEESYIKAFEAYQHLIKTYKASPQFAAAIDAQFRIAQEARNGKIGSFLGVKKKLGTKETLEMYQTVIDNAPQGKHAAQAKFEIAEINEEQENISSAINAYQDVVDEYPKSKYAAESQKKIAALSLGKIEGGSQDAGAVREGRAAAMQAASLFPSGDEQLNVKSQFDEKAADNAYNIGRFYEKQGNAKAAIIYYNDVLRFPGGPHFEDARDRVNNLTTLDPTLLDQANVKISNKQLAVRADADVKSRPDYVGPPRPADLEKHLRKPKMRTGTDSVPMIPLEEPALPGEKPAGKPDDSLLQPSAPDLTLPAPAGEMKDELLKEEKPAEETRKAIPAEETTPEEKTEPSADAPAAPAPPTLEEEKK